MDYKTYLSEIGTRGGRVKSSKKTEACRANARKPRPKARKVNKLAVAKNS